MSGRIHSRAWGIAFAAGLLLRPVLIAPMAPAGPLGGSDLLPVALAVLAVAQVPLAIAVLVWPRPGIALGMVTAVAGVPLGLAGAWAGLPEPWALALAAYNAVLAAVGVAAWREASGRTGAAHRAR